jgi:hypothetical protein
LRSLNFITAFLIRKQQSEAFANALSCGSLPSEVTSIDCLHYLDGLVETKKHAEVVMAVDKAVELHSLSQVPIHVDVFLKKARALFSLGKYEEIWQHMILSLV